MEGVSRRLKSSSGRFRVCEDTLKSVLGALVDYDILQVRLPGDATITRSQKKLGGPA